MTETLRRLDTYKHSLLLCLSLFPFKSSRGLGVFFDKNVIHLNCCVLKLKDKTTTLLFISNGFVFQEKCRKFKDFTILQSNVFVRWTEDFSSHCDLLEILFFFFCLLITVFTLSPVVMSRLSVILLLFSYNTIRVLLIYRYLTVECLLPVFVFDDFD